MEFLRTYSEIGIYKAYSRSIAIDFSLRQFYFFGNEVMELLSQINDKSICELQKGVDLSEKEFQDSLNFLEQKNIFFRTKYPKQFPVISHKDQSFSKIDSAEIVFTPNLSKYLDLIIDLLIETGTQAVKLHLSCCNDEAISHVLACFTKTQVQSIQCVLDFNDNEINEEKLNQWLSLNRTITYFSIENIPNGLEFNLSEDIMFIGSNMESPQLAPSYKLYKESLQKNTYFNKKIFIGSEGQIKNAKECNNEFGNLKSMHGVNEIIEIINSPAFSNYWIAHKDNCDICKDCEFRHICVDNRLPVKRKNGSWFYEDECRYNPYICKWAGEDGYYSLSECGVVSNEKTFSIDHERVKAINTELWDE
jgi:hypothetical protein